MSPLDVNKHENNVVVLLCTVWLQIITTNTGGSGIQNKLLIFHKILKPEGIPVEIW